MSLVILVSKSLKRNIKERMCVVHLAKVKDTCGMSQIACLSKFGSGSISGLGLRLWISEKMHSLNHSTKQCIVCYEKKGISLCVHTEAGQSAASQRQ